ncbi:hypothetical protein JD844_029030 [Phrynosoma platyrhinos]|uniref:C2H2-type domain-containing protein n=1 Tax=Phrynosoma platyrhinos TaxID=52577 RepID=A0ABQ7SIR7_PHRPL|nr:hypothetical protein JD844_029030 [Phrynosoma platyrhinos]
MMGGKTPGALDAEAEFPRDLEHKAELHRRGSLCDRHCTAVNNPHGELGDMHSGSHHYGHSFLTPRMLPVIPNQSCCPLHSEEVQTCDACLMKTTITAENEVEANKLSNNYKMKTCNHNCNVKFSKYDIIAEGSEGKEATPLLTRPEELANPDPDTHWHRPSTYVWLLTGYPFLSLIHGLICLVSWLLVFYIPIAKMNVRIITKVLLTPPEQVHIQSLRKTAVLLDAEVVLCCYRACNAYYYKYAVDGINVFAVRLTSHRKEEKGRADSGRPAIESLFLVPDPSDHHAQPLEGEKERTFSSGNSRPAEKALKAKQKNHNTKSKVWTAERTYRDEKDTTQEGPRQSGLDNLLVALVLLPGAFDEGSDVEVAYIIGLVFALKTHCHIYDIHISDCHLPGHHHSAVVHWSRWRAMLILLVATLCMSACADLATEHISPILNNSPVSQVYGRLVCGECQNVTQEPPGHYICQSCHFDLVSRISGAHFGLFHMGQKLLPEYSGTKTAPNFPHYLCTLE